MKLKPEVGIIMGSTSDLPVMQKAAEFLNEMKIAFEINALSAHRTPDDVLNYARAASERGIKVIIAGAGGAAHLPGVIAAATHLPVIGVPLRATISLDGWDSVLSIVQMPPGVPVATVGIDGALNAGILALQILAIGNTEREKQLKKYKLSLAEKIVKANKEMTDVHYEFKTN